VADLGCHIVSGLLLCKGSPRELSHTFSSALSTKLRQMASEKLPTNVRAQ